MAEVKKSIWQKIGESLRGEKDPQAIREQQIADIELKLGHVLPASFRAFLFRNQEQIPYYDTCDVFSDAEGQSVLYHFCIRKYLSMNPGAKDDYVYNYFKYQHQTPKPLLLPIAFDTFRNIMLISLQDGMVYFWDKESRIKDETGKVATRQADRLYYVADDFDKFEGRLYRMHRFS